VLIKPFLCALLNLLFYFYAASALLLCWRVESEEREQKVVFMLLQNERNYDENVKRRDVIEVNGVG
jgi:hypothetical protein